MRVWQVENAWSMYNLRLSTQPTQSLEWARCGSG